MSDMSVLLVEFETEARKQGFISESTPDPKFIAVGNGMPDYSGRLRDDFNVVGQVSAKDGLNAVYYSPRRLSIEGRGGARPV